MATGSIDLAEYIERAEVLTSIINRNPSLVFAKNESNDLDSEKNSKQKSTREGSEKDRGSKSGGTDTSTKAKPAPEKSFVPSEKIPAEQAVDFPVDI